MIYTLTLSPSIDYMVRLDHEYEPGRINRISEESYAYGGKGVNVSQVLKSLDVDTTALGFIAGFTGDEIEKGLNGKGVLTDFVHLKEGHSRINLKIRTSEETELNAVGPGVPDQAMVEMFGKIRAIGKDDMLVIAGTVPRHMPSDIYARFIEQLTHDDTKIVVDTTGENFINALPYHPFLVKPNHEELSQLLGEQISPFDKDAVLSGAKMLKQKGARNVLVSLASQGALLLTEDDRVISREAPNGIVKNSVGSGDAMVAGFIAGYLDSQSLEDAFYMGLASGSATAFMEGLAGGQEIRELYRFIR
ncbi:MAG: 1-phosphofructokinase family hexose kinase [Lachnospiraceae bacterium]|nr:1-phosphofructokinase family hexose kinase [Lachnospiraceae bacterium]